MSEYTQGVAGDGVAILKDGQPMTIEQILEELRYGQDMDQAASDLSADLTHFGQQLKEAQAKLAAIGKLSPTDYDDREHLLGAITRILRGQLPAVEETES